MIWKDINEYEGLYQVSDKGLIISKSRMIITVDGKTRFVKGRLLKLRKHDDGYRFVSLCRNGKCKNHYVHRLVAEAFIPNEHSKPEVNHLNGKKTCNYATNLAWATHAENVQHAYDTGLSKKRLGRYNARKVRDKATNKLYGSIIEAADDTGIGYKTLRNMLSGSNTNNSTLEYEEG